MNVPRNEYVVSTKLFWDRSQPFKLSGNRIGTNRKKVMESMDASLKRLQMDYVVSFIKLCAVMYIWDFKFRKKSLKKTSLFFESIPILDTFKKRLICFWKIIFFWNQNLKNTFLYRFYKLYKLCRYSILSQIRSWNSYKGNLGSNKRCPRFRQGIILGFTRDRNDYLKNYD